MLFVLNLVMKMHISARCCQCINLRSKGSSAKFWDDIRTHFIDFIRSEEPIKYVDYVRKAQLEPIPEKPQNGFAAKKVDKKTFTNRCVEAVERGRGSASNTSAKGLGKLVIADKLTEVEAEQVPGRFIRDFGGFKIL